MKIGLVLPIAGLALGATLAAADTMNLGYACRVSSNTSAASTNDFNTGGSGVCDDGVSYIATKSLVCSFKNTTTMTGWSGTFVMVDIQTLAPLPDFWNVGAGGCRQGAVFSPKTIVDAGANCTNPFAAVPADAVIDTAAIRVDVATGRVNLLSYHYIPPTTSLGDLPPPSATGGYLANNILIAPSGADVCPGCDAPACIVLTEVDYFSLTDIRIVNTPELRNWVTWNGGVVCYIDPVRNSTWGRIKALYR
jgi:hypothetical protein